MLKSSWIIKLIDEILPGKITRFSRIFHVLKVKLYNYSVALLMGFTWWRVFLNNVLQISGLQGRNSVYRLANCQNKNPYKFRREMIAIKLQQKFSTHAPDVIQIAWKVTALNLFLIYFDCWRSNLYKNEDLHQKLIKIDVKLGVQQWKPGTSFSKVFDSETEFQVLKIFAQLDIFCLTICILLLTKSFPIFLSEVIQ